MRHRKIKLHGANNPDSSQHSKFKDDMVYADVHDSGMLAIIPQPPRTIQTHVGRKRMVKQFAIIHVPTGCKLIIDIDFRNDAGRLCEEMMKLGIDWETNAVWGKIDGFLNVLAKQNTKAYNRLCSLARSANHKDFESLRP